MISYTNIFITVASTTEYYILGLHRTTSRVSIDSVASYAGSVKTQRAFKKFCQNLYQSGVRAEMIKEKEKEILDIFQPKNTSGQIGDSNISGPSTPHMAAKDEGKIEDQSEPQNIVISRVDDRNIIDQRPLPAVSNFLVQEFCLYLLIRNTYTNRK